MNGEQILDIGQQAIFALLWVSAPLMAVALVVGLIIALFQALTSIQEMTLTFVPKILFVFLGAILFFPFMGQVMLSFGQEIFSLIAASGG